MKKVASVLLVAILISIYLLIPAGALGTDQVLSEGALVGHLENESDINRYTFEFAEAGDAVIFVQAMQENWTGYTYYWNAAVYHSDGTLLAESRLKGSNELNFIALDNLEAGTYFVEISAVKTANPLMGGFTTDPYEIALIRCYNSYTPSFDDEVQVFDQKYQIIGKVGETFFIKTGEGRAFGAFYRNDGGAILPMLVSESAEAVNYIVSSTGDHTKSSYAPSVEKDGVTYYYTNAHWIDRDTENKQEWQSQDEANYLFIDERQDPIMAEELLIEVEKAEKGLFWYYLSNYWYVPLLIIVFLGFLAVSSFCQVDGPV